MAVKAGRSVKQGDVLIDFSPGDVPKTLDEHTPLRIFTKANVSEAGTPPKLSTGYGNAYVSGYNALWGTG